jgi:hypothetical protein
MRKYSLIAAAFAAMLASSCGVDPIDEMGAEPGAEEEITVLTAGFAAGETTKTVRQADGKVFWSPGDAISVIRGTTSSGRKKFVSDGEEPSPTATFSGTMPSGSAAFWAVYPYNADTYYDGNFLVTELPSQQEAVAGSFADNLFISAAYVSNSTTDLSFYHQCGGVKFSVTQPGIRRVTLIAADNDAYLAGLIGLKASRAGSAPYVSAYGYPEYMSSTIDLSAPEGKTLELGAAYHFVTLPVTLSGGFSLMFEREDGWVGVREIKKDITIKAAHFATLMEADKGVVFQEPSLEYSPENVTIDGLGGLFAIEVSGTLDYHIESYSDWLQELSSSGDARVGVKRHAFLAERNDGEERTGMLSLCYGDNCYPIMVTQTALGSLKVYPHHTLGMRFTATWCQHCPTMDETFRKARAAMGDGFEYICFYDTSGEYGFAGSNTLCNLYQINSFPSAIIDGREDLPNYNSTDYGASVIAEMAERTVKYYPTATTLGIESSLSGRNLSLKIQVKAQYEEEYKIAVFLVENDIIGNQMSTSSNMTDFNHSRVARMCLTASYTGDLFEGPAAGGVKTLDYTATIPEGYKLENMAVVAYVLRNFNDRPVFQSGSYGDWYVDNSRCAALGVTVLPED